MGILDVGKSWLKVADAYQEGMQKQIMANIANTTNMSTTERATQEGIMNVIHNRTLYRSIIQIDEWRAALDAWENEFSPDRSYMMEVYQEIALDTQVAAKMGVAQMKIEASEFQIVDDNNKVDDKLTKLLQTEWFSKFLKESLNADYYGYTLFQFPTSHENFKFDANELLIVPRHVVLPRVVVNKKIDGLVVTSPGSQTGASFKRGRYASRCLGIGDEMALGMFSSIAPLFIYKKNALSFWSGYQQLYGEPTMKIKMSTEDDTTHKNYQRWLETRGTHSGIIVRGEDDAEILEANRHDAHSLWSMMVAYSDESISKAMEGNTLTSDAGGGKTKGDVHADVARTFHLGRLKKLAYAVNDHLIPFLEENYGFNFEGKHFKWKEFIDKDAEVDNIMKLSTNFELDPKMVEDRTGYPVIKQKEEQQVDNRAGNRKKSPDKDDNTAAKRT